MITAKVIADSISPRKHRLTSFLLRYPRFAHADFLTHRVFSRNASSSRARPVTHLIEEAEFEPAMPMFWGKNQKGMQAFEELQGLDRELAIQSWNFARLDAVKHAKCLNQFGLHKQLTNRILEPFTHITVICTATEFGNFFNLRAHVDAMPELQELAFQMLEAYNNSVPNFLNVGDWHLPFADKFLDVNLSIEQKLEICTARAARLSYMTFDNLISYEKDKTLHDDLAKSGHWCYDDKTEVLTDKGWLNWSLVNENDKLAAIEPESGLINFEKPINLYKSDYNGEMYSLVGQQIDLNVTPNHNMIVCRRNSDNTWKSWEKSSAINNKGRPCKYLKAGYLSDEQRIKFVNPFGIDEVTFAKLIGFYLGDGTGFYSKDKLQFNIKLDRKVKYLHSLNLPVEKMIKGYSVNIEGIGRWFEENFYINKTKQLNEKFLLATSDEINGLLDGLKNSDGSIKRNTWIYDTTSETLKNQIQMISHINNISTSVSIRRKEKEKHNTCYRLNFSDRLTPRVEFVEGRSLSYEENMLNYNGIIYCATVSTGALIVRRNDKVVVSGNSPFEHSATALDNSDFCGNFKGWKQYRKLFANENRKNFDIQKLKTARYERHAQTN